MKILISGTSGLIGSALCAYLSEKGHQIFKLKRDQEISLESFDAVIHLAGESIAGRWNEKKKEEIRNSRIESTKKLGRALSQLKHPPKVFICASAIGFYGDRGDELLTEESTRGKGFLSDVCVDWEAASLNEIRTANLRFGIVLSPNGGALKQMLVPFKIGLGGPLGSGKQYMSWVALEDVIRAIDFVLHHEELSGPINITAPAPVTNEEFTPALGKALHRPTFLKVPAFAIKWLLGEMGEALLLSSTRAIPKKLLDAHFEFKYPSLQQFLNQIKQ